ncbi:MAG: glycosyltransferase [Verrucomicrobiae bacterium]
MRIHFYLPKGHLPSPERQASWMEGRIPDLLGGGKSASAQSWIFQTWAELCGQADIEMVHELPASGIIVTLSNFLPDGFLPQHSQFIAAVTADFLPHPGAHVQIVQNAAHARRLPGSIFMPHWPQPNLVPRDPARGTRFDTIAFFGDPSNLAGELSSPAFARELESRAGVRFEIHENTRWHDYSDVDAVLAVRDFSRARHLNKPATKLYNAWLAGVPLIGGRDSAFSAEGHEGADYLVARSVDDCISHVCRLKKNPASRKAIVDAGSAQAAMRSRDAVRLLWQELCSSELPTRRDAWKKKPPLQQAVLRQLKRGIYFLDKKIRS